MEMWQGSGSSLQRKVSFLKMLIGLRVLSKIGMLKPTTSTVTIAFMMLPETPYLPSFATGPAMTASVTVCPI